MKIYRAVKSNLITQKFYENLLDWYKQFGMTCHGGLDFLAYNGEPIYFDCDVDGFVLNTEIDSSGGLGVNIITESEEGIFKHRYWHLKDFFVKAGDKVKMGECIGWADNTGKTTGSHLHRDTKEMFKDELGTLYVKNQDNGTYGTICFDNEKEGDKNWFINEFVLDVMDPIEKESYLRKVLLGFISKLKGRQ